jgi:glyoxylase-like metal-dependent hydrolase (beta-lactamase superfamily II)
MTIPEKITDNLYRIKVPLPEDLLPYTNAYVIRGADRHLIIDSGMDTPRCKAALKESLQVLDIDLGRTDFFITHFHRDHLQLALSLVAEDARIFISRVDHREMELLKEDDWFRPDIPAFSRISGFPETDLRSAYRFFEQFEEKPTFKMPPITLLNDGDLLQSAGMTFRCIMTPGHSKGHLCLYDAEGKRLFAGDHLLNEISPTIQARFNGENPLEDYLSSLDKINSLEVDLVLPGHKRPFSHFKSRIEELRHHHHQRNGQILHILSKGPATAYRTASAMSWNVRGDAWEQYAPLQRFMAVGETISHLNYLLGQKKIEQKRVQGQLIFSLSAHSPPVS